MRMNDVLLDTTQHQTLQNLGNEYLFRVKKLYLFSEILDKLYSCEFEKLFEASTHFFNLGIVRKKYSKKSTNKKKTFEFPLKTPYPYSFRALSTKTTTTEQERSSSTSESSSASTSTSGSSEPTRSQ